MTMVRKKLIEVSIPLEAINVASAREKSIRHGHPSTLHLWWARRPLAACRAVLFAQLVDDPSAWPERFPTDEAQDAERRRLHKIIERMVPWEASNDEAILSEARWEIARSVAWGIGEEPPPKNNGKAILNYLQTKAPPVYDPFSGGGSIPLEAQRLGLRAYGSDLNPVAVLIGKALVEIPPKFSGRPPINPKARAEAAHGELRNWIGAQGLAEDVRYYGQWMRDEAEKRIGTLYPKARLPDGSDATVIAWIWVRTVRSPDPMAKGAMVPLASSFMLATKGANKSWVELIIDSSARDGYRFEVKSGSLSKGDEDELKKGTKSGRGPNFTCALTGSAIGGNYIKAEGSAGRMGARLLAIVAKAHRGQIYVTPTARDEEIADLAVVEDDVADLPTSTHPQYMGCVGFGLDNFRKLFTRRQLAALALFSDLIDEVREKAVADALAADFADAAAYANAVATYLAFANSRMADRHSSLTLWDPNPSGYAPKIAHTFGRQALPMVWDFTEGNPFSSSSGNFADATNWIAKNIEFLPLGGDGSIEQIDAAKNNYPVRPVVISTDPPYYDNIPYADLSDFFYVWLKRSVGVIWPDLFRRLSTPKAEELVADAKRHNGRENAEAFFMSGMGRAIEAMRNASTDDEPLTIYYAFKQAEISEGGITSAGWASFLQAIVDAGLVVDGTWPIRTELANRMRGQGANALASSIVLVCRKLSFDAGVITRADFVRALKLEMPKAIDKIRKAGVGPVDMQQSVIGPGMGIFSRYAKVLEDDDSAMTVKTALLLINRVWEEIENELDTNFDAETQVALAWFATYGFDPRSSGELITLANAKNIASITLFNSGVFKGLKGKAALTPRHDWWPAEIGQHDSDEEKKHKRDLAEHGTATVWACVQKAAAVLNAEAGGGEAAGRFVAQMGQKAEAARALAYRLFEIATKKGWSSEALVYNELAQEWTRLEDIAVDIASPARATTGTQGAFAFDEGAA